MKPKILFINHPTNLKIDLFSWGARILPLNLAYLASYLRLHLFPVEILDADFLRYPVDQVVGYINKNKPDIVGLTSVTGNFHEAVRLARAIKKLKQPPLIIIGGVHITALPGEMRKYPFFDFAVIGEGEETLLELVKKIEKGQTDFEKVLGLAFLKKTRLVLTPPRPYIKNLDKLPMPAFDLLPPISKYHPSPGMYRKLPMTMVITSRGCPGQCIFCYRAVFGNVYRARSPKNVVDEVETLVKKYGVREIRFCDDLFTFNEDRVMAICQELRRRKLKISWSCNGRANFITKRMLKAMKTAGCWQVAYGIESGNQEILNRTKKGLTLETIRNAVHITRQAGLETRGFFILGLPGENEQTLQQTIDFAKELHLSDALFSILIPYPGTEIAQKASKFGKVNRDFRNYHHQTTQNPPFIPHALSAKQILDYYRKAQREFFLRPSYLAAKLLDIKALPQLWSYPTAFFSIIRQYLK